MRGAKPAAAWKCRAEVGGLFPLLLPQGLGGATASVLRLRCCVATVSCQAFAKHEPRRAVGAEAVGAAKWDDARASVKSGHLEHARLHRLAFPAVLVSVGAIFLSGHSTGVRGIYRVLLLVARASVGRWARTKIALAMAMNLLR